MTKNRMEAFSDGVLAIIITIMVLKLTAPNESTFSALKNLVPTFVCYSLSYAYIGTYWVNHHELISKLKYVNGKILWKNMFFLFCLSIIPFATEFMGKSPFKEVPTFVYGVVLFFSALSYVSLQNEVVKVKGKNSEIAKRIGRDFKGKGSIISYIMAVILSMKFPILSSIIYFIVPIFWIIPDIRLKGIEED